MGASSTWQAWTTLGGGRAWWGDRGCRFWMEKNTNQTKCAWESEKEKTQDQGTEKKEKRRRKQQRDGALIFLSPFPFIYLYS